MRNLLRHDIFYLGLQTGVFATLSLILIAGIILLWRAPWVVPFGQAPLSPQKISMLRWNEQGFPLKVEVDYSEKKAIHLEDITFDGNLLWVTGSTDTGTTNTNGPGSVFIVDPRTLKTTNQIVVGEKPRGILFDGQHIWVANRKGGTVSCIDRNSEKLETNTRPIERTDFTSPYYLAFDGKDIWVTSPDDNTLWRMPAGSCQLPQNEKDMPIRKDTEGKDYFNKPYGIIFDGTYIWVANRGSNEVIRLDPHNCIDGDCTLKKIAVGVEGSQPYSLAYDGKYVWVTLQGTDQVARIDAKTGWVVKPLIDVGRQPWGIAYDGRYIWVANNLDKSVSRLRAKDGTIVETFETSGAASRFAFDGTFMWVTNYGDTSESSFLVRR